MYVVLSDFADLQDGNHVYHIGDEYPRAGYSRKDERVDELRTGKNLLHKPLIQLVRETKIVQEVVQEVVQKPDEVVEEAVEEPKRRRGRKTND